METVEIDGEEYFTATGVASEVGVCRQTLWRWRQCGRIPSGNRHRTGQVLFTEEEVELIYAYANRVVPIKALGVSDPAESTGLRMVKK